MLSPLEVHALEDRCHRLELENQRLLELVSRLVDEKVTLQVQVRYLGGNPCQHSPR